MDKKQKPNLERLFFGREGGVIMAKKPTVPRGLGARGRKFWRDQVSDHEFTVEELLLLAEACRCVDRLDRLEAVVADEGVMSVGSMGQTVTNPALQEARQQQVTLLRLVTSLGLGEKESLSALEASKRVPSAPSSSGVRGRFQVVSNAG